jgi:hypothetical protein
VVLALLAATASFGSCPSDAVALTRADLPAARRAVLHYATHQFARRAELDPRGARATGTRLGPQWAKWGFIANKCGRKYLRRTAVVAVRYPAEARKDRTAAAPCNSCAGLEFLASRTKAGRWVVWYAL